MAILVTTAQANRHLRLNLEGDADDSPPFSSGSDDRLPDLELKIEQAEAIVINYLKLDDDALDLALNGDPDTSPVTEATWNARDQSTVQAAVLLLLSALYDDAPDRTVADYLKPGGTVPLLLVRLRDPALA